MNQRPKINSAASSTAILTDRAKGPLAPPDHLHLSPGALPFWNAIMAGRQRSTWLANPSLLATAASLAWVQHRLDEGRRAVDAGQPMKPGLFRNMSMEITLLRVLQMHGRATDGETRDVARRRQIAADIAPFDDLLLAKPQ